MSRSGWVRAVLGCSVLLAAAVGVGGLAARDEAAAPAASGGTPSGPAPVERVALAAVPHAPKRGTKPPAPLAIPVTSRAFLTASGEGPARYLVRDGPVTAVFSDRGLAIGTRGTHLEPAVLRWGVAGAREVAPVPQGAQPGRVHYLKGDPTLWKSNLPSYARLTYERVRPGIDLDLDLLEHGVEYTLRAGAGADLESLRLRYQGAHELSIVEDGAALEIRTGGGALREEGPRAFQLDDRGQRHEVSARYAALTQTGTDTWEYAIELGATDRRLATVIDPGIVWSRFLGGTNFDEGWSAATDAAGNLFLTGQTLSSDFPENRASLYAGNADAFVAKYDPWGTLVWATFLGGGAADLGQSIAVDSAGYVYVGGYTASDDFPTTPVNVWKKYRADSIAGRLDGFISKLAPDGNSLVWSSYVGGVGNDTVQGLALGPGNTVYLTGWTAQFDTEPVDLVDGPAGAALDCGNPGACESYALRLSADGKTLDWLALFRGTGSDYAFEVATDFDGGVFVGGATNSPVFAGLSSGGSMDGFLVKLVEGPPLARQWARLVAGSQVDKVLAVAADSSGNAYVAGTTNSTLPITGGFQTSIAGLSDVYVAKYDSAGALAWSGLFGGSSNDQGESIAVDSAGVVYVAGYTASSDLPVSIIDTSFGGGGNDGFVARIAADGRRLDWAAYLGGSGDDKAYSVAVDHNRRVYVTGNTTSTNFPADGGTFRGVRDAFAMSIEQDLSGPVAGVVNDGTGSDVDTQELATGLGGNWSNFVDPESGVVEYQWAIGIAGALTSVQPFTSVGNSGNGYNSNLSLVPGVTYFVTVRAFNGYGASTDLSSDGVLIVKPLGDGCSSDWECKSGFCAKGVCCESACAGACQTCAAITGSCGVSANNVVCRPADGGCDVAENCAGNSTCPPDLFAPPTQPCRASAGACDSAEFCSGASPVCPPDFLAPSISVCRPIDGGCDLPEYCTGLGIGCPADSFKGQGTTCRAAAGVCDLEEVCTGAAPDCPADLFAPVSLTCRPADGGCDVAEQCPGTGPSCPGDGFRSAGAQCRAATDDCDLAEACTGTSPQCPVDRLAPPTQKCRPSVGGCDPPELCTGTAPACPADLLAPPGYECRLAKGACDVTEVCSGTGAFCPEDGFAPAGTPCGTGTCKSGVCAAPVDSVAIVRNANFRGVVGVAYVYNASGAIEATGAAPITFDRCGGPAGFEVDQVSGAVTWVPAATGAIQLCVQARNNFSTAQYQFTVTVQATAPASPVASFSAAPVSGPAPLSVSFDGSGSTFAPSAGPLFHRWSFGDGSPYAFGAMVGHVYPVPGGFLPRLMVLDSLGGLDSQSGAVSVLNSAGDAPPVARILANAISGTDSLEVGFSCDCQPGSSPIVAYRWDFANGATSATASTSAAFGPGRFRVRLEVVDAAGLTSADEVPITVTASGQEPPECAPIAIPAAGPAPLSVVLQARMRGKNPPLSASWEFSEGGSSTEPIVERTYADPGSYLAFLRVVDAKGLECRAVVRLLALTASGERVPKIVSTPATVATCTQPYRYSELSAGPVAETFSALAWTAEGPAGLAIAPATGALTWTPTTEQAGRQHLVLRAQGAGGEASQEIDVEVSCPGLSFSTQGCGCGHAEPLWAWAAAAALWFLKRRRSR